MKTLGIIVNAPGSVANNNIHKVRSIPKVKTEINKYSSNYINKLNCHSNILAINLLDDNDGVNRLKRYHELDLPFRTEFISCKYVQL